MRTTDFPEYNSLITSTGKLPVKTYATRDGKVVVCWRMSFIERLQALFTGRIWAVQATGNKGYHPTLLTTDKDVVFYTERENKEEPSEEALDKADQNV